MAPVLNAAAAMALAGSASAFVAPSAFKGQAVTSAKPASSSTELSMSVDCGINGFGRIGRLVARSMIKNPDTNLKLINTGAAPEYMAYQVCPMCVCASSLLHSWAVASAFGLERAVVSTLQLRSWPFQIYKGTPLFFSHRLSNVPICGTSTALRCRQSPDPIQDTTRSSHIRWGVGD